MRRNKTYLAKINGSFINYLSLHTNPIRLKNTYTEKESILYFKSDFKKLLELHSNISFIEEIKPIKYNDKDNWNY